MGTPARREGNKRLHAWAQGDTPPMVEFQIDGKSTSGPAQILTSKRQFWSTFGVLKTTPTATFELHSPYTRQHMTTNRYPRSLCPRSTQLCGHREDEQVNFRICWDQPTSLPFQTGAARSSPTSSTRSNRRAPGHGSCWARRSRSNPKPATPTDPWASLPMTGSPSSGRKSASHPCRHGAENVPAPGIRQSKDPLRSTAP